MDSSTTYLVLANHGVVRLGAQSDAAVVGGDEQLGAAVSLFIVPVPRQVLVIVVEFILSAVLRFAGFV